MLVVPVYNVIVAPDATLYLQTEQIQKCSVGKGFSIGEKVVLIVAKDNVSFSELNEDSFLPIGVTGSITDLNEHGFVIIRTDYRVNIEEVWINPDHTITLSISRREEINDLNRDIESEKLKNLLKELRSYSSKFQWSEMANYFIDLMDSFGTTVCSMSAMLNLTNEERYAILAEDSRAKRTELIEKTIYEFIEVGRITTEALASQQREYRERYKESAIKRQMAHLQKELDEMHPENVSDAQRFSKKIAESGMNEAARKEAEKVLNRFKQEGRESAESGILYDYLDFLTGLSWKKEEAKQINLDEARKILDEDHYGLKKVKDRIVQQIAVMNLKKQQSGSILLFVGAPGTGKTSIGKSIARALGREYVRVSLGGVHDESDIRGHRRTYIGAMPGRIMDAIHKSGTSNPVMVLDEVDKLSDSFHGSPASALLEVLDPEQNNTFTDHYMNVPYDLSDVLFVCTANTTDSIPEPLLNRMEVITFSGYSPIEKLAIAKHHLVPKSMSHVGITKEQMHIEDMALELLISDYTRESGVRGLRKCIDTICRILAVQISSDPDTSIVVTPELVREEMDSRPIQHGEILPEPKAGIATGLAWTAAGVTLVSALASLLTGRIVDPHIAMTGEVALRGAVMPIGGLPEKLMAAERSGITKVYIPKENLMDLKDVASEVKDKLEIIPVSKVTEILTGTGIIAS